MEFFGGNISKHEGTEFKVSHDNDGAYILYFRHLPNGGWCEANTFDSLDLAINHLHIHLWPRERMDVWPK